MKTQSFYSENCNFIKLLDYNLDLNIYTSLSICLLNNRFKLNKEYKESYQLTLEQKESLIGLILGDLSIEKGKHSLNARLRIKQSIIHEDYLIFLYNLFKPLTNMQPKIQIRKPDSRTGKQYNSIRFATLAMPCLNYYHDLFYYKENFKFKKKFNISDPYNGVSIYGQIYIQALIDFQWNLMILSGI